MQNPPAASSSRRSSAVLAIQPVPDPAMLAEPSAPPLHPPRQPSLFPDERAKVIPFDSYSSGGAAREHLNRARRQNQAAAASAAASAAARASQQKLDFRPRSQTPLTVYEEAPVASTRLRVKAALLDALFCLLGAALAAVVFRLVGGAFHINHRTAFFYAGALAAMLLAYRLFWCLLGRETVGMSFLHLQLLTFDGSPPDWRLRLFRFSAAGLSLGPLGLGLFWALMDEEGLTWHDHISRTFPTVQDPNPGSFRRK
jgi:uncharacterized RDD family membrane protein YckC